MSQQNDVVTVGPPEHPDEGPIVVKSVGRVGVAVVIAPQRSKIDFTFLVSCLNGGTTTMDNAGWLQFGNLGQSVTYKVVGVTNDYGNTILDLDRTH